MRRANSVSPGNVINVQRQEASLRIVRVRVEDDIASSRDPGHHPRSTMLFSFEPSGPGCRLSFGFFPLQTVCRPGVTGINRIPGNGPIVNVKDLLLRIPQYTGHFQNTAFPRMLGNKNRHVRDTLRLLQHTSQSIKFFNDKNRRRATALSTRRPRSPQLVRQ